ncbi:SRPBCC family protein [Streptomyces sp. NPDC018029]|uniref:SRPBCC family protein n=1 Tax=Streptomyces sp. NPDC018029 TaxID=3365032 RepID=UPI0037B9C38B
MARRLRPVGLEFVDSAPVRLVFVREVSAPPEAVYHALAEDVTGWPRWFTAVTLCRPTGGGTGREVRLKGGTRFQESILAADGPVRYTYRVDETNAPGLRALVEEWRLAPARAETTGTAGTTGAEATGPAGTTGADATGTRVQWTFAMDGTAPLRGAMRLVRPGLGRSFRDAVTALDRQLAAAGA